MVTPSALESGLAKQPAQPGSGEAQAILDAIRKRMPWASHHSLDCDTEPPVGRITLAELSGLQSALTECEKLRDQARDDSTTWKRAFDREVGKLTAAQREIDALQAALRTYGWHKPECDYMQEELPCTCGFMDAVKEQGNG